MTKMSKCKPARVRPGYLGDSGQSQHGAVFLSAALLSPLQDVLETTDTAWSHGASS